MNMNNGNKPVSKAPLIASAVFSAFNLIFATIYGYFSVLAIPIAFNPNPGVDGIGLAVAIIIMLITGAAILLFGLIATLTAKKYKKTTASPFAKTLIIINLSFMIYKFIIYD